ncbi:unnamed protein product [Spirodela intermedia]|uniref:SCP domain-containing protein n=1 Tax=Spirodela intermedia TaxID=51605 RepID=A0A7I8K969_SPIIN|nr:unnamed protein product [Spirodela intermedia]
MACVLVLAAAGVGRAQYSPQDYLDAHNEARAQVGVGSMEWDDTDRDCQLVHSEGEYGENLCKGPQGTAADAVELWVSENQYYDYNSNSCEEGRECGHYTQVVWRNSVKLGCARVTCNTGDVLITCNYSPPGNYGDERPY